MWPFNLAPRTSHLAPVFFTNTLSGAKEEFRKKGPGPVAMYSCGPTVYGPAHIGNLRSFVFSDLVARVLAANGYRVKRVMNITDVGHLVGDGDEGEDKMAVGAARDKTTPEAIADTYAKQFLKDIEALGLDTKVMRFPRATEYIKEQIAMIRTLEKKGLAYRTNDGVYFDAERFPGYGALGNARAVDIDPGTRVALGEKRSPHDFALWRSAKPGDLQQWDSPWGRGNPGWSIECSAMAVSLLGPIIDIHTGGQDHIQVHHNNEIAQSEGATGKKPFARIWMHNAFLTMGGEKLSKSLGNTYTLDDVKARGIHPLALRYLFLQAHYRSPLSFSWESLKAADEALSRLWSIARQVKHEADGRGKPSNVSDDIRRALADDLGTPKALAKLWEALSSSRSPAETWGAILAADEVLGLSLAEPPSGQKPLRASELPEGLRRIARERAEARERKEFARSDELRIHLLERGYRVEDTPSGQVFTKLQKD